MSVPGSIHAGRSVDDLFARGVNRLFVVRAELQRTHLAVDSEAGQLRHRVEYRSLGYHQGHLGLEPEGLAREVGGRVGEKGGGVPSKPIVGRLPPHGLYYLCASDDNPKGQVRRFSHCGVQPRFYEFRVGQVVHTGLDQHVLELCENNLDPVTNLHTDLEGIALPNHVRAGLVDGMLRLCSQPLRGYRLAHRLD